MPTSLLFPDDDDQSTLNRNLSPSPRPAVERLTLTMGSADLLVRFNPRLVGFGIVSSPSPEFLKMMEVIESAPTENAVREKNPEEQS